MKNKKIFIALCAASTIFLIVGVMPLKIPVKVETESTTETKITTSIEIEQAHQIAQEEIRYRGNIIDRNGIILCQSVGSERRFNDLYDVSIANLISSSSQMKLDEHFSTYLRSENPSIKYSDDNFHLIGKSIQLTIDGDIQNAAYQILEKNNIMGSITILESTGSIIAAASCPSFSHNSFNDNPLSINTSSPNTFNNQCFTAYAPGSIFKIASGTISKEFGITEMIDKGRNDLYDYANWDYFINNTKIPNPAYPIKRNIQEALLNSSNYFFGEAFFQIGADNAIKSMDKFFACTDEIQCDFGTLRQEFPLTTNSDLCRSGFGQRVAFSPLYMAAIGNAVVSGEMCKPYILKGTIDTVSFDKIEVMEEKNVLRTIPKEYRTEVLEGMEMVTEDLGFALDGKKIFTKTGTAEIDFDMYGDFLYILSVVNDIESGEITTVLLEIQNPDEKNYAYAKDAKAIQAEILSLI